MVTGIVLQQAPGMALDTNDPIIFYNRPQDVLGTGIVASIILLAFLLYSWRTRYPIKPRLFWLVVAIFTALGPGLIGLYLVRGGKPAELLAVSPSGVWCHSWGIWVPWREISWVDTINTSGEPLNGRGEHRGVTATFDLKESGLANHAWVPAVKIRKQATCVIDNLDRSPDEAFRTIRKYYQAAQ